MTGPEHYRQAEQLLHELRDGHAEGTDVPGILTAAQVHATLALAAATATPMAVDGEPDSGLPPADAEAWFAAAGTKAVPRGDAG